MPLLKRTAEPSVEPVTLAEAKVYLSEDNSDRDSLISGLIASSRAVAENITRRSLIETGWSLYLDGFYDWESVYGNRYVNPPRFPGEIELRMCPATSAVVVYYTAPDGAHLGQSLLSATDDFQVDLISEPARIRPNPDESWPETQAGEIHSVKISFTAGYGTTAASVPQAFKDFILARTAFLYENRGDAPAKEPEFLCGLLDDYRWGGHC